MDRGVGDLLCLWCSSFVVLGLVIDDVGVFIIAIVTCVYIATAAATATTAAVAATASACLAACLLVAGLLA